MQLGQLSCCGIKEIIGCSLWSPQRFQHLIAQYNGKLPCAYVIFNGVHSGGYVAAFRDYLTSIKVGEIDQIPSMRNPNSQNLLDVCIWRVDRDALLNWYLKLHADPASSISLVQAGCACSYCMRMRQTPAWVATQRPAPVSPYDLQPGYVAPVPAAPVPVPVNNPAGAL